MKNAIAKINGGKQYPDLRGRVLFCQSKCGVKITAEISGLPQSTGFFGFHIHEGGECSGNDTDEFACAKNHYNPEGNPHPEHRGDLPPLMGNDGYAYMSVLTNRFTLCDVIGKVIVIHSNEDDFTTQPGGASGEKIGCGVIKVLK